MGFGLVGFYGISTIYIYVYTYLLSECLGNQKEEISLLYDGSLKLVDKFSYLGSSFSSSENDINKRLAKA